ncbi:MAG: DegT/DnrJ/EryC1/StrS aminotransferase family protein [Candidatus Latescibacteria bacterium]|nr:DegT/DnrJ/EryC1/StrS aminotransferase family protein [Candidatus Latescibacterota bacterium]
MIPHSRPSLGPDEAEVAAQVIRSGWVAQGPQTEGFEEDIARQAGMAWGTATSSGTAALHLALLGIGAGPGDRVVIPSYVCVALLHAVRYVGAEPVIVDVDPETMNLDPDALRRAAPGRLKAVILPHLFGLPAEVDAITAMGAPVIEDCAHAVGATVNGRPVGGLGTLSIYSFYATKMMTTGEGGMVVGQDSSIEERVRGLRDYDRPDASTIRFNYKMTDIQAAIGRVQLRRLPSFLDRRRQVAQVYDERFQSLHLGLPAGRPGAPHAYYRYIVRMNGNVAETIARLDEAGVACRRPVAQPLHRLVGGPPCPGADAAFDRALSIPIYPTLTDEEVEMVSQRVSRTLANRR